MPADEQVRKKHRVPELFDLASYAMKSRTEKVRGIRCVLVEAPGHDVLWLAPEMNLAVVKRRLFFEGNLSVEIECHELRKATSEIWLPTRMIVTEFAVEGFSPEQYAGRAIVKWDYRFTQLEANSKEHEHLFVFNPEPGSIIIDETLGQRKTEYTVGESGGTPHVSYIAPVDKNDLDAVIAAAVREQTSTKLWPLGLSATVLIISVALSVVGYIIVSHRRFRCRGVLRAR
jgi:hypothetical protein